MWVWFLSGERDYHSSTFYLNVNKDNSWIVGLSVCSSFRFVFAFFSFAGPTYRYRALTMRRYKETGLLLRAIVSLFQCAKRARGKLYAEPTPCLRRPYCKDLRKRLRVYFSLFINRTRSPFFAFVFYWRTNDFDPLENTKCLILIIFRDILVHN